MLDVGFAAVKITQPKQPTSFALNADASGIVPDSSGGFWPPGSTLLDILNLIFGGGLGAFLRSSGGEVHVIDTSHPTLTGMATFDLTNGNVHPGTLTGDVDITPTGWPVAGRGWLQWSIEGDGTSTPTFLGVTWIDTAPGVIGSGDFLHGALWSDDNGTTIWGAVAGGGSGSFPGDVFAHGAMGATETLDYGDGTAHTGTLDDDATVDFTGFLTGKDCGITFLVSEDGTGGHTLAFTGVTWLGGVTPTHDDTPSTSEVYAFFSFDGGTTIIGGMLGAGSGGTPATTVTDETTFGITPAVGTDTEYARQDHTHGSPPASHFEILMAAGISSPPEPLENGTGTDWLWVEVFP